MFPVIPQCVYGFSRVALCLERFLATPTLGCSIPATCLNFRSVCDVLVLFSDSAAFMGPSLRVSGNVYKCFVGVFAVVPEVPAACPAIPTYPFKFSRSALRVLLLLFIKKLNVSRPTG